VGDKEQLSLMTSFVLWKKPSNARVSVKSAADSRHNYSLTNPLTKFSYV